MGKYKVILLYLMVSSLTPVISKLALGNYPLWIYFSIKFVGVIILTIWLTKQGIRKSFSDLKKLTRYKSFILTNASRIFNLTVAYYCLSILPIQTFVSLEFPITLIITLIFVTVVNKKLPKYAEIVGVLITASGIFITYGLSVEGLNSITMFLMILNGLSIIMFTQTTQEVVKEIGVKSTLITQTVITMPVSAVLCYILYDNEIVWSEAGYGTIGVILLTSITTAIANYTRTLSVESLGYTATTIVSSVSPVIATLWGLVLLQQVIKSMEWLGLTVTFMGVIMYTYYNAKKEPATK